MMKTLVAFVAATSLLASAQDLPTVGQSYTVKYNPQKAGILVRAEAITVVYAFNVWTARVSSSRAPGMLMYYVTHPDPQRVNTVVMKKRGRTWNATIEIPTNASLLSYYFKGEDTCDYNHGLTYVTYIYTKEGKPVRDARFRNIAFMNEAGANALDQLTEIENELRDYPDNYIAYIPYWMLRFDTTETMESLRLLRKKMDEQFDQLETELGPTDTLRNVRAGIMYRYALKVGVAAPALRLDAMREFKRIVEQIPTTKRYRYIQEIYGEQTFAGAPQWLGVTGYGLLVLALVSVILLAVEWAKRKRRQTTPEAIASLPEEYQRRTMSYAFFTAGFILLAVALLADMTDNPPAIASMIAGLFGIILAIAYRLDRSTHRTPGKQLLYWSPRALCITSAVFVSVFALDVFSEGLGFWTTALAFLLHLIPTFLILAVLLISWRREWIGGILCLVLGVLYIAWSWGKPFATWSTFLLMVGPLVLTGVLFLIGWRYRRELTGGER